MDRVADDYSNVTYLYFYLANKLLSMLIITLFNISFL